MDIESFVARLMLDTRGSLSQIFHTQSMLLTETEIL